MDQTLKPGFIITSLHFDFDRNQVEVCQRYSHEINALSIPGINDPEQLPTLSQYIKYQNLFLLLDKTFSTDMVYIFSRSGDRKAKDLPQVIGVAQYKKLEFIAEDEMLASDLEFPSPLSGDQTQPQQENDNPSS